MNSIKIISDTEVLKHWKDHRHSAQSDYLAMYSSWSNGITLNPDLMTIPIDDHMAHRGDAVFEAMKFTEKKIYLFDAHLQRLQRSAEALYLKLPFSISKIKEIIFSTCKAAQTTDGYIRLFVSRGPGGFSTNPYESVGSQLYVVVTRRKVLTIKEAHIGKSQIPTKQSWLAQIKSCNYLPNVLMKKEAVDQKLDFVIGITENGCLTEGSTENIIILDAENNLVKPLSHFILKGTTMTRVFELAQMLVEQGKIKSLLERDISESEFLSAREAMMVGTTLDVLPVATYNGVKVGNSQGVAQSLLSLILEDQKAGKGHFE